MKIKLMFIAVVLFTAFGGYLMASDCASCETSVKAVETCADGECAVTEAADKKAQHSHKKEKKHADIPSINTAGLKTILDSGVPVILLDARSGKWDDGKRIPGAHSLNAESKIEEIKKILPDKNALVVTYCSNLKCPASNMLFKHLKTQGYTNLLEYPEGIQGWIDAGHQVKSVK